MGLAGIFVAQRGGGKLCRWSELEAHHRRKGLLVVPVAVFAFSCSHCPQSGV